MPYGKKHAQWENEHLTNHNRDPPTIPFANPPFLPPESCGPLSILVRDPSLSCAIASPQMKLSCSFYKCGIPYVQLFQEEEEAQSLETLGSDLHRQQCRDLSKPSQALPLESHSLLCLVPTVTGHADEATWVQNDSPTP